MRFLIVNTDYGKFLQAFYTEHSALVDQPYDDQMRVRNESLFGTADFYSKNLRTLGHEAWDVHANNEPMQRAWAREHGLQLADKTWHCRLRKGVIPWLSRRPGEDWFYKILATQIRWYKPDVLLSHDLVWITPGFLREVRAEVALLVGQHAATTLREDRNWSVYDLVLSSFPPTVQWFQQRGAVAKLFRLGFEETVLAQFPSPRKDHPLSFVGSFQAVHRSRTRLLEDLAPQLPLKVWGAQPAGGFGDSPLTRSYMGPAWGLEMFKILAGSRVTINHHGDVPPYANNMRLYEATGMGALLLTDWKENLHELFEPGKEVVTYRTPEECMEQARYYLEHEDERAAIARAGQQRTLREHTYRQRMEELVALAGELL